MIKCENCKKHTVKLEDKKMVHGCNDNTSVCVFGYLDGPIVPDCGKYVPDEVSPTHRKSLAETAYIMAGGKYVRATEKERSGIKDLKPWRPLKRR